MDELKMKLSSRFMRGILSKLLSKTIANKVGYDVDIHINEILVETIDGKVHLHTSLDAEVSNDEFKKIVQTLV